MRRPFPAVFVQIRTAETSIVPPVVAELWPLIKSNQGSVADWPPKRACGRGKQASILGAAAIAETIELAFCKPQAGSL